MNLYLFACCRHVRNEPRDELLVVYPLVQVHQEADPQLRLPGPVLGNTVLLLTVILSSLVPDKFALTN